jgi:hypothetical protein
VLDPIQYCPLLQRRLQTVEIDIRDDTGSIVPFERGRVVVTLHCRKRKEFSLEWNQLTILGHLPPFSVPPRDNTRTENLILSSRPLPNLKHTPPPGI